MSRALTELRPEMRRLVDPFLDELTAAGIDYIVTCTLRTFGEQMDCWNQGRLTPGPIVTNAKPGQSAHNYGMAIDIVPSINGKPDWDGKHPIWQTIGDFGQARGLEWYGAPGSAFVEFPHFQLKNWRELINSGA